jgi:hypothetical protein
MAEWTYFRDQIRIDESLAQEVQSELRARNLPSGSTLLVGARHIEHSQNYTLRLEGYHPGFRAGIPDSRPSSNGERLARARRRALVGCLGHRLIKSGCRLCGDVPSPDGRFTGVITKEGRGET